MNFLTKLFTKFDKKTQTEYISPIDQFITQLDKKRLQKSASQLGEINNQKRINYLRDHAVKLNEKNKIWTGF